MDNRVNLPQDFVRLMHEHYDAATADTLCDALDTTEPEVSIRLNPRKLSAEEVLEIGRFYEVRITQADFFDCYGTVLE